MTKLSGTARPIVGETVRGDEVGAHGRNAVAMWTALAADVGDVIVARDDLCVVAPSPYHALRAIVLRPGVHPSVIRDAILPWVQCRRVFVEDLTAGLDLAGYGFVPRLHMTVMTRDVSASQSTPHPQIPVGLADNVELADDPAVAVEPVAAPVPLALAEAILAKVFPGQDDQPPASDKPPGPSADGLTQPVRVLAIPGWQVWLARIDGQPVGGAYTYDDGASIGVYQVATLPGYRRRGVGGAVMVAILAEYPDRVVNLTASAQGRPLYERIGFRPVGETVWWAPNRTGDDSRPLTPLG